MGAEQSFREEFSSGDVRGEVETYYLECGGGGGDTKLVWDDIVRINELTGRVIAEKKEKGGKS